MNHTEIKTSSGRLIVVKEVIPLMPYTLHRFNENGVISEIELNHWYCGYVEIKSKKYKAKDVERMKLEYGHYTPSGEISLIGELADYPGKKFMGFDTLHAFTADVTKKEVINACRSMAEVLDEKENIKDCVWKENS